MRRIGRLPGIIPFSFLIMLTMIAALIIFTTIISVISYSETRQNLENNWMLTMNNTEQHLTDSIHLVSDGLRLFELTYDPVLKQDFVPFLEAYNTSDRNPMVIDLIRLKEELPSPLGPKTDLYIIDDQGIIINSTLSSDLGLDFKTWPDVYRDITRIREGDMFRSDRAVIGFKSDQVVRKYAYLPTPDHRYLLELSIVVDEYMHERKDFSLLHAAESVADQNPEVVSITLFDSMFRSLSAEGVVQSVQDNETVEKVRWAFAQKKDIEVSDSDGVVSERFIYIQAGGNETVSDNMLNTVAHIRYDPSSYLSRLRATFQYHLLIAAISVFLAILLGYYLTRHLTRPIRQIIDDIDSIAKGDLDHPVHHTGSPEFTRLEGSITLMVRSLKTLIETLREKEDRLVTSEQRYRSLVESQTDLIIRFDQSGIIRYTNQAFYQAFQLTPDEVIGKPVFDLVSGDLLSVTRKFFENMAASPSASTLETRIEKRDGTTIWVQWVNQVITDQDRVITEYQSVGRDITKRKSTETALRESEEKYRLLVSNLPDFIIVHQNGKVLLTNDATATVLGYKQEDLINTHVLDYVLPEYHDVVISGMKQRIQGEEVPHYEIAVRGADGSLRQVIVRASIISSTGIPTFLTVLTDITERKKAEELVIEGERKYRRLVEQLNEGILITDTLEATIFTNSRMQEILGYTGEELIGKEFSSFVLPEEIPYLRERIANRNKGISERYSLTLLTRHNKQIFTEISASPSMSPDGTITGSIAVVTDVTRRKKAEKKLEKYTHDLEQKTVELEVLRDQLFAMNKDLDRIVKGRTDQVMKLLTQKDEFIMQLGHDLRTPLTPVLGLLPDLISEEEDELTKKTLLIIHTNVRFIQEICDKSLKLAKMSSFDIKPDIEPVEIRDVVTSLLNSHAVELQAAGITARNAVPSDLVAGADPILFHELLDNLVSNGIKYIQRKDGELLISGSTAGEMIEIRVADNGQGLRAGETEKIFDVFYKSDRSRHDKTSTGLGLAICRRIVENHRGSIRAESPGPGRGTTFIILLPAWKY
ncbi:PAS domain-containing sensor histidine kinase [uncultured Methanospirillum sp.]|uniref:PAS domain-containing sensor histidine kinase n=1 Tax=uncultured Methanospirillum sp. TaxID=262503 RepID=UPI0029C89925|nr:PAS domain-containing sensor histidine kinase [uncultured Methanospirillum sp.]